MPTTESRRAKPQVCKSHGQTGYKRSLSYARLGIDAKDVQRIPYFAAQLKSIARAVRGADKNGSPAEPVRALDFLKSSENPEARKVLKPYLSIPESYRRLLPPEAFCHVAGVSPWVVLEAITVVAVRQGATASAIVAAISQLRVVEKTIERALQNEGTRERAMMLKATGFLPPG